MVGDVERDMQGTFLNATFWVAICSLSSRTFDFLGTPKTGGKQFEFGLGQAIQEVSLK